MELITGTAFLVQACLLPGLIVRRLLFPNTPYAIATVFSLSLVLNHILVVALSSVGFYKSYVAYPIILLELIVLAFLPVKKTVTRHGPWALAQDVSAVLTSPDADARPAARLFGWLSASAALLISFYYLGTVLYPGVDIVRDYDGLVSWNQWAEIWSAGGGPHIWYHYPQLVPTTLSLAYMLSGGVEIQTFAASIDSIVLFATFATLTEFAYRRHVLKDYAVHGTVLFSSVAILLVLYKYLHRMFDDLNADIYVAMFYGFMAIFLLEFASAVRRRRAGSTASAIAEAADNSQAINMLVLAAIAATGAALSKQAGLLAIGLLPLLAFVMGGRGWFASIDKKTLLNLLVVWAVALAVGVFWFVFASLEIEKGATRSEISYLTLNGQLEALLQRFVATLRHIHKYSYGMAFVLLPLAVLGAIVVRHTRAVFLFGLLYAAIWALFFSYDGRNLFPSLPIFAIMASFGLAWLVDRADGLGVFLSERASRMSLPISPKRLGAAAAVGAVIVGFLAYLTPPMNWSGWKRSISTREALLRMDTLGFANLNYQVYYLSLFSRTSSVAVFSQDRHLCPVVRQMRRVPCQRVNNFDGLLAGLDSKTELTVLVLTKGWADRAHERMLEADFHLHAENRASNYVQHEIWIRDTRTGDADQ